MNNPYADCITFTENEITLRSLDHPLELSHPYYVFNGDVEKILTVQQAACADEGGKGR
jgi:hypothetical protein